MSRWPFHRSFFWQEAPAIRPLIGYCGGILFFECCPPAQSISKWILSSLLVLAVLLVFAGFRKRRSILQSHLFPVLFWLLFGMMGWSYCVLNEPRNHPDWFGHHLDSTAGWIVRLTEAPQARANSFRTNAEVLGRIDRAQWKSTQGRVLVYFSKSVTNLPVAGDTLLIPGRFAPIRSSTNPFAFDYRRFQNRQGVYFQQFLPPGAFRCVGSLKPFEQSWLDRVHLWCDHQLNAYIQDTATRGLLQAMILGEDQALDPELRQTYSETGVVHIVSISGAHVAVLFLVVTGLLQWIRGRKGNWIRYCVGLLLVWWYVLMAGAPPSALRSAVMFSVIALSILSGRQGQNRNTLASAALILLVGNPGWLFSVGFQLSFLAVLSMMLFYPPLYALWPFRKFLADRLGQALAASLAAELLTGPLVIYYFHNFPIYFLIANLLASLLVGMLALIGGMAVIVTSGLPPLAQGIACVLQSCVQFFNRIMQYLQESSPTMFHYLQIDFWELLLIYLSLFALLFFWLKKESRALWIAFPSLIVLLFLLNADALRTQNQDRLIVYENGSKPLVERVRGSFYGRIAGEAGENFNASAVHTGWNAWRPSAVLRSPLFRIREKTALVLTDCNLNEAATGFPLDVLVWAGIESPEPEKLLGIFQPKTLVFAGRLRPAKRAEWTGICARRGIVLHEAGRDGAFLLW